MKFIDQVKIRVIAGDGGRGCISFRREKFIPRGGPNGGNGGKGGDVIALADPQLTTLLDLRYQKQYKAGRGEHGLGKDQHGKTGEDRIIKVPVGTLIRDAGTGELVGDLKEAGQQVVVAAGGRGGKGNAHFVSSTNRSPRFAQPGEPGEDKELEIELRLLADVGIIGLPNAGKSTLIAAISATLSRMAIKGNCSPCAGGSLRLRSSNSPCKLVRGSGSRPEAAFWEASGSLRVNGRRPVQSLECPFRREPVRGCSLRLARDPPGALGACADQRDGYYRKLTGPYLCVARSSSRTESPR